MRVTAIDRANASTPQKFNVELSPEELATLKSMAGDKAGDIQSSMIMEQAPAAQASVAAARGFEGIPAERAAYLKELVKIVCNGGH